MRRISILTIVGILAGTLGSAAQSGAGRVTFHPVDTGRSAVVFDMSALRGVDSVRFAVKTNLPYLFGTLTPNASFEWAWSPHSSVEAAAAYNGWGFLWDLAKTGSGPEYDPANYYKRRFDHLFVRADYHYWLRQTFRGHYFGAGLFYTKYRIGEVTIPSLFEAGLDYYGNAFGASLSYGWVWRPEWSWARRWAAEFSIGAGFAIMVYDKSSIATSLEGDTFVLLDPASHTKAYLGPTSVGIKLVYLIK
jgi:hypothetical protein